jgi:hypothetical protein
MPAFRRGELVLSSQIGLLPQLFDRLLISEQQAIVKIKRNHISSESEVVMDDIEAIESLVSHASINRAAHDS